MATCSQCGATERSNANHCGTCGSEILDPHGIQFIDLAQPDAKTLEMKPATGDTSKSLVLLAGAAVALLTVVYLIAGAGPTPSTSSQEALPSPESSAASTTAPGATVEPFTVLSPSGLGSEYDQSLAVRSNNSILLVNLETGVTIDLALDQPAVRAGLASAGDHLAYLGQTNAFLVASDGSAALDLGPADTVVDAATPASIWIGEQTAADRMSWREIDSEGTVLRTTLTAFPLDFDQPDLRWGHQNRMLRLTEEESQPWRIVAQGSPVAVGPNDLILAVCEDEADCDRRWFSLQSGLDQGPLLADLADRPCIQSGGVLSPKARYVSTDRELGEGVAVVSLATGGEVENDCSEVSTLRWSTDDALLACPAQDGVVIHELETGTRFVVDSFDEPEQSFAFVSN